MMLFCVSGVYCGVWFEYLGYCIGVVMIVLYCVCVICVFGNVNVVVMIGVC